MVAGKIKAGNMAVRAWNFIVNAAILVLGTAFFHFAFINHKLVIPDIIGLYILMLYIAHKVYRDATWFDIFLLFVLPVFGLAMAFRPHAHLAQALILAMCVWGFNVYRDRN